MLVKLAETDGLTLDAAPTGVPLDELRRSFRKDKRPGRKKLREAVSRLAVSGLVLTRPVASAGRTPDSPSPGFAVVLTEVGMSIVGHMKAGDAGILDDILDKSRAVAAFGDGVPTLPTDAGGEPDVMEYRHHNKIPADGLQAFLDSNAKGGFRIVSCASYLSQSPESAAPSPYYWLVMGRPATSGNAVGTAKNGKGRRKA